MLWTDSLIPPPMECCLRFMSVWPEHDNKFLYPFYAFLNIISLVFQFFNTTIVFRDLESLTANITNLNLIFNLFLKITIFWNQRRYVKEVLNEMNDDWNKLKNPEEINIMKSYARVSHKFFLTTIIVYNLNFSLFFVIAFRTYISESVENRIFPLQASFPFTNKVSPVYELISFSQTILLILTGVGYSITDTSYIIMVLHATSKLELLQITLDRVFKKNLKSGDVSAVKIMVMKHLNVIRFTRKVEKIHSGQLIVHFLLAILQVCFLGFTCLVSDNISTLINSIISLIATFVQLGTYCVVGEYLQTKSHLVAIAVYLLPWYNLKSSEMKSMMLFIQRAQKPLSITAGKLVVVSHFTFIDIIKASASYLSVLRAIRI